MPRTLLIDDDALVAMVAEIRIGDAAAIPVLARIAHRPPGPAGGPPPPMWFEGCCAARKARIRMTAAQPGIGFGRRGRLQAGIGLALALATASAAAPAPSAYGVVDRIKGPDGGWDFVRIDSANRRILVTRGTSVMSVDLATGDVSAGLAEGQRLHDVVPVNDGKELLVTQGGANAAVFVDAKTGREIATIPTGENPDAAAYDPGTGVVLIMNHSRGDITVIDARNHRRTGSIEVGGALEMAALDGSGRAFVNVEDRNEIAVVDIARRKVVGRYKLPGCEEPTGIAYDPVRRWLIAACDGSTDVLDARSGALVRTLKTGEDADGVAIDPAHRVAFVPGREGSLSVISLAGSQPSVAEVLRIQPGVRTLAVDADSGRVYLPTAKYERAVAGQRPSQIPGSFEILVVGRLKP